MLTYEVAALFGGDAVESHLQVPSLRCKEAGERTWEVVPSGTWRVLKSKHRPSFALLSMGFVHDCALIFKHAVARPKVRTKSSA